MTLIIDVLNDINYPIYISLVNCSAAFDLVDHSIVLYCFITSEYLALPWNAAILMTDQAKTIYLWLTFIHSTAQSWSPSGICTYPRIIHNLHVPYW